MEMDGPLITAASVTVTVPTDDALRDSGLSSACRPPLQPRATRQRPTVPSGEPGPRALLLPNPTKPTRPRWAHGSHLGRSSRGHVLQGSQEAECPGPAPHPCPFLPPQHKLHLLPPFCFWVESEPGPSLPPAVFKEGSFAPIQPEQPFLSECLSWKGPLPGGQQRRGSSGGAGVGLGPATGGRGMGRRQPSHAGCKEVTARWLCAFRGLCHGSAYT